MAVTVTLRDSDRTREKLRRNVNVFDIISEKVDVDVCVASRDTVRIVMDSVAVASRLGDSLSDTVSEDDMEREAASDDENDGENTERVTLRLNVSDDEVSSVKVPMVALPSLVPLCERETVVVRELLSKRLSVEDGDGD